jgi:futalosine hydrolase
MRVLIVAATGAEAAPVTAKLQPEEAASHRMTRYTRGGHDINLLVSGVGLVATAANVSKALGADRYDFALNIGVCGSFDTSLPPGTAVHIVSDCLAELGAEDDDEFVAAQELGLVGANEFPFRDGQLVGLPPPPNAALDRLPRVRGISVSTVHGRESSIAAVVRRLNPQVESMEGAAFVYACLIHNVPSAQVRVVSNVVERRNRNAWKLAESIDTLATTTLAILDRASDFAEAPSDK